MVHNEKRVFFEKIDGPLSSLAFNCLQLSCLLPGQDTYCSYESNADTANWMGQLVKQSLQKPSNSTLTLRDMVLPGSHDSASATIGMWKPFSAAGRTQNLSVGQQLGAGIRYLDVRVASATKGSRNNLLSIWHGCLEGGNFDDVMSDIADFVKDHPKEFVLLELVPEYGKPFQGPDRIKCLERAFELLGGSATIFPANQVRDILTTKPYVQVAECPQSVVVLLHERFFDNLVSPDEVAAQYGFVNSSDHLRNPWNNTRDITQLLAKNLQTAQDYKDDREHLVCNQFFVTPGVGNANEIVGTLTGQNSLRPVSHACRLYAPSVLDHFFVRRHANEPWNIISLDFVDLCPEVVNYLIALNWKTTMRMNIELAAMCVNGAHQDVTKKVQSSVCRDTVLFLVDPEVDVSSGADQFFLTVAYSLSKTNGSAVGNGNGDDTQYHVATIAVSCDAPVILSPFCSNKSTLKVEIKGANGSSGVAYRDQVFSSKDSVPDQTPETQKGALLEFSIQGSKCEFRMAS
jgi:hypothetical protein